MILVWSDAEKKAFVFDIELVANDEVFEAIMFMARMVPVSVAE